MSNEAITEKPERRAGRDNRPRLRELAPSILREEEPQFPRIVGTIGLGLILLGILMVVRFARLGWGSFFLALGFLGVLFHAASDKEMQVRRTYTLFGFLLLAAGVVVSLIRFHDEVGGLFWLGFLCMSAALLFVLAAIRHETDELWRNRVTVVLGAVGGLMALIAFISGNIQQWETFLPLLPRGLLLALLGLGYVCAFVGLRGTDDEWGYRAGLGLAVLGALVFLIALGRSALPALFFAWHWLASPPPSYLVPSGFILMCLGLLYAGVGGGICSDRPLLVLTRRELAGFFYSPIAYIVLIGFTCVAWVYFILFLGDVVLAGQRDQPFVEPIVRNYMFGFVAVVTMIFLVPLLTMRLLSEEKRTGTLEMLLTVPVNETVVLLSKFIAALIFFLLTWLPWGLFLVALRIEDGKPFDYRPMLSFLIAMTCMGAAFISMGLFFSSLTRNQIASAVLTFVGMILFTGLAIIKWTLEQGTGATSAWVPFLEHISYVELWYKSLAGQLTLRYLVFQLSAAVLWLFMTVKVLEARRWA